MNISQPFWRKALVFLTEVAAYIGMPSPSMIATSLFMEMNEEPGGLKYQRVG